MAWLSLARIVDKYTLPETLIRVFFRYYRVRYFKNKLMNRALVLDSKNWYCKLACSLYGVLISVYRRKRKLTLKKNGFCRFVFSYSTRTRAGWRWRVLMVGGGEVVDRRFFGRQKTLLPCDGSVVDPADRFPLLDGRRQLSSTNGYTSPRLPTDSPFTAHPKGKPIPLRMTVLACLYIYRNLSTDGTSSKTDTFRTAVYSQRLLHRIIRCRL